MYFYKYYKANDKYTLDNIKNNLIYFSDIKSFNDLQDSNLIIVNKLDNTEIYNNRLQNVRVSCFSTNNSSYMWEHYADSGNGFCIEYGDKELHKISKDFIMVHYASEGIIRKILNNKLQEYVNSAFDKKIGLVLLITAFSLKEERFKNEKEMRILSKIDKYSNIMPNCIYIGDRVDEKSRKEIIKHCHENSIKYVLIKHF